MIGLDKFSGSCSAVEELSTKIYIPSKTKDVNVKALNMKTRTNEVKTLVQHISMIANVKSIIQHIIQIKNGIMINVNGAVKRMCKKDYSWNPSI